MCSWAAPWHSIQPYEWKATWGKILWTLTIGERLKLLNYRSPLGTRGWQALKDGDRTFYTSNKTRKDSNWNPQNCAAWLHTFPPREAHRRVHATLSPWTHCLVTGVRTALWHPPSSSPSCPIISDQTRSNPEEMDRKYQQRALKNNTPTTGD